MKHLSRLIPALALMFTVGCASDSNDTDTATSTGTATTTSSTTAGTSTGATTTTAGTDTAGTTGALAADGEQCSVGTDCMSGKCYVVGPLGGVCGECEGDADCMGGGCSLPNPLSSPMRPPMCNMGELGGGCQSADVCQAGLVCPTLLNAEAVGILVQTCSECASSAECTADATKTVCAPTISVLTIEGKNECIVPNSHMAGEGCDYTAADKDMACGAGLVCALYGVIDASIAQIGMCGPCDQDSDCAAGQTCVAGSIDTSGTVTNSMCM